uniref:Uncharacterized protein n=1 Tax=Rhizophora mucronata TaxID=61149 RepID=A0A2P2P9U8_RHIMU
MKPSPSWPLVPLSCCPVVCCFKEKKLEKGRIPTKFGPTKSYYQLLGQPSDFCIPLLPYSLLVCVLRSTIFTRWKILHEEFFIRHCGGNPY